MSVLAAFAAETAYAGSCAAVCGAASWRATLSEGVSVLRPLDVRASLGGPLPLLPLVELVSRSAGRGVHPAQHSMLSSVIYALTALLRGEPIHKVELLRCDALGMLCHLIAACPAQSVNADVLAAFCGLESALEGSEELSDQLLHRVFLRFSLWARSGFEIMQPVLRQLCRMAGDRPEQWARTDALARLFDAMIEEFSWRGGHRAWSRPTTPAHSGSPSAATTEAPAPPTISMAAPAASSPA